jgi:hypothetical protein
MQHAKYVIAAIGLTLSTAAAANPNDDLGRALFNQDQKAALAAIAAGANPEGGPLWKGPGSPLYDAVYEHMWDVALELVNRGANVNARTAEGNTPLLAALEVPSAVAPQVVSALLDHGADANVSNSEGNTALALAVLSRNPAVVRMLLAHGANPNAKSQLQPLMGLDSDLVTLPSTYTPPEMTAFQVAQAEQAAGHGNAQIVELLRNAGAGSGSSRSGADSPTAADADQWFRRPHFSTTAGRVGYHVVSNLQWYASEFPPQCRSDHDTRSREVTVRGTLPPGLTADPPNNFFAIQGTPRQPGDWSYAVLIHGVWCHGQFYGDRRVDVTFHVDP